MDSVRLKYGLGVITSGNYGEIVPFRREWRKAVSISRRHGEGGADETAVFFATNRNTEKYIDTWLR